MDKREWLEKDSRYGVRAVTEQGHPEEAHRTNGRHEPPIAVIAGKPRSHGIVGIEVGPKPSPSGR
jgi:hypothetical protein